VELGETAYILRDDPGVYKLHSLHLSKYDLTEVASSTKFGATRSRCHSRMVSATSSGSSHMGKWFPWQRRLDERRERATSIGAEIQRIVSLAEDCRQGKIAKGAGQSIVLFVKPFTDASIMHVGVKSVDAFLPMPARTARRLGLIHVSPIRKNLK